MALNRPFTFAAQVVIAANSVNSAAILIGSVTVFDLSEIFSDIATAGVNIIMLRDSTGLQYTNASTTFPIPIAQLITPAKVNMSSLFLFVKPLNLVGQVQLVIDVQNTTVGSVTVNFAFRGFLSVPGAGA